MMEGMEGKWREGRKGDVVIEGTVFVQVFSKMAMAWEAHKRLSHKQMICEVRLGLR